MRIIKRYANRKLYDTSARRYINLVEIADLVQGGSEVKVLDSKTNEDITKVTLSQILLEKEKRKQGFVPQTLFTNLIRKSTTSVVEYVKKSVKNGLGIITWAEEEIDKGVKKFVHAGQMTEKQARHLKDDLMNRLMRNKAMLEKSVEKSVELVLHRLNIAAGSDITHLTDKVDALARRVQSLNGKPGKAPKAAKPVRRAVKARREAPPARRKPPVRKGKVATVTPISVAAATPEAAQEKVS